MFDLIVENFKTYLEQFSDKKEEQIKNFFLELL